MKKIILSGLLLSVVFASSLEERVKILEEKVAKLEQKLNMVGQTQKTIKQDISNGVILKCNKLKLVKYSFDYYNNSLTSGYNFTYVIKNNYKKPITYLYAAITFSDNNHIQMVENYIKQSVNIEPNKTATIHTSYLLNDDSLGEALKNTPKKDIRVQFKPFEVDFKDGKILKCQ